MVIVDENINYFQFVDNFKKNNSIQSILIKGNINATSKKLCILIPTYKRNDLLRETIYSALNQIDFDDFEVIVLDNNPERNCNTEKLINTIVDSKLFYYKNTLNLGMFGNWNRGFELSRSEWTVMLHDDDIISPFFLSTCSKFLKDKSIALIKPEITKFSVLDELNFHKPNNFILFRYYLIDFLHGCKIGAPTCILYNTATLISSGGFNQDYFPCADYVSSVNIAKEHKIFKLNAVLGGYRVSDNESLNENTMNLFYEKRFYISSFIMRSFHFPRFLISLIQSALMGTMMRSLNSFYNVKIEYDYESKLKLKRANFVEKNLVKICYVFFLRFMDLFRSKWKYKEGI